MNRLFLSILLTVMSILGASADTASRVRKALEPYSADPTIGVAVVLADGDTVGVNADKRFSLESVMKFYQAVALSHILGERVLDDSVHVTAADLKAGTWSPLRARYPEGGITVTPAFLLDYSLQMSDNNAADILFDRYGTPAKLDSVVRAVSRARDFALRYNEDEMHGDTTLCTFNNATPADAATLMFDYFCFDPNSAAVQAIMARPTPFGTKRLLAGFPVGKATVLHKTGTGFNATGHTGNINDAGFVFYPRADGSFGFYSIAVFLADREGSAAEAEALIAEISEAVWTAHLASDMEYALSGTVPAGRKRPARYDAPDEDNPGWFAAFAGAVLGAMVESAIDRALGIEE